MSEPASQSSSPTAPTSPLVALPALRYTASAPLVGECQVVRDGSRWVLRPHAPHVEGQCSCCAEIELVMDVDVALSAAGTERWLVTRNDGCDLGHLTHVPEPAPWCAQMPVADPVADTATEQVQGTRWSERTAVRYSHTGRAPNGIYLTVEAEAPAGIAPTEWRWRASDYGYFGEGTKPTLDEAKAAAEAAIADVRAQRLAGWEECQRLNEADKLRWRERWNRNNQD